MTTPVSRFGQISLNLRGLITSLKEKFPHIQRCLVEVESESTDGWKETVTKVTVTNSAGNNVEVTFDGKVTFVGTRTVVDYDCDNNMVGHVFWWLRNELTNWMTDYRILDGEFEHEYVREFGPSSELVLRNDWRWAEKMVVLEIKTTAPDRPWYA